MDYELTAEIKISVIGARDVEELQRAIVNLRQLAQGMGIQISESRVLKIITDLHVTAAQDENGVDLAVDAINSYV